MNQPIRVLQLGMTHNYGGIESYVMNMYRQIDRNRIQFDFVDWCGNKTIAYQDEIKSLGGRIYKIPPRRRQPFANARIIKQLINSGHYQVIYNHLNSLSYLTGVLAGRKNSQTRVVAHSHNDGIEGGSRISYFLNLMNKMRVNKGGITRVACSQAAGNWMFKGQKFEVLPNAIDTQRFSFDHSIRQLYRHQLGLEGSFVVGSVARLTPQKKPDFLLNVFSEIAKHRKNARLLLVGDGKMREELIEQAAQLKIKDRVIFMGVQQNPHELLQVMDVLVAPSEFEGFGISVLEAQCAGLPCYVSEAFHQEVVQTSLVHRLSLKQSPKDWAYKIISDPDRYQPRCSMAETLKQQGYDVVKLAQRVEKMLVNGGN